MTVITTRITVAPDGTISTAAPLPAGSYTASIEVHDQPARLPMGPYNGDTPSLLADLRAISLRSAARLNGRELLTDADLYDENGLPA